MLVLGDAELSENRTELRDGERIRGWWVVGRSVTAFVLLLLHFTHFSSVPFSLGKDEAAMVLALPLISSSSSCVRRLGRTQYRATEWPSGFFGKRGGQLRSEWEIL